MSLRTALRRQLKGLIRRIPILGPRLAPCASTVTPAQAAPQAAPVAPQAAPVAPQAAPVAPQAAPVAPQATPPQAAPPQAAPVAPQAAPPQAAPVAPAAGAVDEEKIRKHKEKAKRGVLKHLLEQGGSLGLGPLHDYSERRWFIAHRGFSNLMEEYTGEGLVNWEESTGMAHITDAGRAFLSGS